MTCCGRREGSPQVEGDEEGLTGECDRGGVVAPAHPGDGVVVLLDAVVRLLQAGRLERRFAHQQGVAGASERGSVSAQSL